MSINSVVRATRRVPVARRARVTRLVSSGFIDRMALRSTRCRNLRHPTYVLGVSDATHPRRCRMTELADILTPEGVILDLKTCSSKRQVLKELARQAAAILGVDEQRLLDALLQRERLGTTGIGHGIAIPHARISELDRLLGVFARLDRPVDFEALDDQPSDLVFLLVAPDTADAESLKALARIARVLRDPAVQQQLRQERDRNSAHRLLTRKSECHAA